MIGHGVAFSFSGLDGEITNISIGGAEVADIDFTHSASPEFWQEFKPGLINAGELTIDVHFDQNQTMPVTRTVGTLLITFPTPSGYTNGGTYSCSAYVKNYPITIPDADKMTAQFVFKLTGKPTVTAAS